MSLSLDHARDEMCEMRAQYLALDTYFSLVSLISVAISRSCFVESARDPHKWAISRCCFGLVVRILVQSSRFRSFPRCETGLVVRILVQGSCFRSFPSRETGWVVGILVVLGRFRVLKLGRLLGFCLYRGFLSLAM